MPNVNLSTLSGPELRRLLDSARQRGEAALSYRILQEMEARRESGERKGLFPVRRSAEPHTVEVELGDPLDRDDDDDVPPMPYWRAPSQAGEASPSPEPEPRPETPPPQLRRVKAPPEPEPEPPLSFRVPEPEPALEAPADQHPREVVRGLARRALEATAGDLRDDATTLCLDWFGIDHIRGAIGGASRSRATPTP